MKGDPMPEHRRSMLQQFSPVSRSKVYLLIPFLLYAYPFAAGLFIRSQSPTVLGRYSLSLVAFNAAGIVIYILVFIALKTSRYRLLSIASLAVILLTYCALANNAMQSLPWIMVTLPAIRILAAATLVAIEFERFRTRQKSCNGGLVMLGVIFVVLSTIDFAILAYTRDTPPHAVTLTRQFRDKSIKLDRLTPGSVILIGDSFVFGGSDLPRESFGLQLEQLLASRSGQTPQKVYSLGIVGAGPPLYAQILEDIPTSADSSQVILSYYMNDMATRENFVDKLRNLSISVGVGAPTMRVLGDAIAKATTTSADAYHAKVIEDYRKDEQSFPRRWSELEMHLKKFAGLARERSTTQPILLVLPIMVDFQRYPLTEAHDNLTAMGRQLGYEVLDLLPIFSEQLGDGRAYRTHPNDTHFNAHVHRLVAEQLEKKMATVQIRPKEPADQGQSNP